jgi:hypothetical protein
MGLNVLGVPVLSSPDDEASLIWSLLVDLRSAGVIVVGDLGEQVRGAVGAGRLRVHSSGSSSHRIALPVKTLSTTRSRSTTCGS